MHFFITLYTSHQSTVETRRKKIPKRNGLFLIFTAFSQYQCVVSLQLGNFISQQFTRKSSGKKTFYCESFFPCGKWDFSTRKKAFSRERLFSTWNPSEMQWAAQLQKKVLLQRLLETFWPDVGVAGYFIFVNPVLSLAAQRGPIKSLESWAHFKS